MARAQPRGKSGCCTASVVPGRACFTPTRRPPCPLGVDNQHVCGLYYCVVCGHTLDAARVCLTTVDRLQHVCG
eukprot:6686774-Prymnesium_polylepis.1